MDKTFQPLLYWYDHEIFYEIFKTRKREELRLGPSGRRTLSVIGPSTNRRRVLPSREHPFSPPSLLGYLVTPTVPTLY